MARLLVPILFGLIGTGILIALGTWQLQRLTWKETILAEIDARIAGPTQPLPAAPDSEADRFAPVEATGRITTDELLVLASRKHVGPGYRVITVFETDSRRILIDRGFLPEARKSIPRPETQATVQGNLHWPDETDSFTPAPEGALWFARDVPAMAEALGTEPTLLILRQTSETDPPVTPMPVDSTGIPNDHLGYAITWFLLAIVWSGMTAFFVWRITRRSH